MNRVSDCSIQELLGREHVCSCGRTHSIGIKDIAIEKGAILKLPSILHKYIHSKILIIQDTNTQKVAGLQVEKILRENGYTNLHSFTFHTGEPLIPDERAIGRLLMETDPDVELMLAVGSGVMGDITRYVSFRLKIPYAVVGTAPSMDGYASSVSALLRGNVKRSHIATVPVAIVLDVDIIKNAPLHMIHSGLGDMLGKLAAIADWKIARLLNNDFYCEECILIVEKALNKCISCINGVNKREEEAIQSIAEGLVLSGIAIAFAGDSRPAAGSEHMLAHYWESVQIINGKEEALHGTFVGVAVTIIAKMIQYMYELDPEMVRKIRVKEDLNIDEWKQRITSFYGPLTYEIVKANIGSLVIPADERQKVADRIIENWPAIRSIIEPLLEQFADLSPMLESIGAPYLPEQVGVDEDMLKKGIAGSVYMRPRYTILNVLDGLTLLDDAASRF